MKNQQLAQALPCLRAQTSCISKPVPSNSTVYVKKKKKYHIIQENIKHFGPFYLPFKITAILVHFTNLGSFGQHLKEHSVDSQVVIIYLEALNKKKKKKYPAQKLVISYVPMSYFMHIQPYGCCVRQNMELSAAALILKGFSLIDCGSDCCSFVCHFRNNDSAKLINRKLI